MKTELSNLTDAELSCELKNWRMGRDYCCAPEDKKEKSVRLDDRLAAKGRYFLAKTKGHSLEIHVYDATDDTHWRNLSYHLWSDGLYDQFLDILNSLAGTDCLMPEDIPCRLRAEAALITIRICEGRKK